MVSLQPPLDFSSLSLPDLDLGNVKDQEACSPACQGRTIPPNLSGEPGPASQLCPQAPIKAQHFSVLQALRGCWPHTFQGISFPSLMSSFP